MSTKQCDAINGEKLKPGAKTDVSLNGLRFPGEVQVFIPRIRGLEKVISCVRQRHNLTPRAGL